MFKLTHSNKNGTFKIILNRDVSDTEMNELCRLATNLIPAENVDSDQVPFGPYPQQPKQQSLLDYAKTNEEKVFIQSKLGEHPTDSINMGGYVQPSEGVRIKMLHLAQRSSVIGVIKALRKHTDISIVGCKDIVYGNYTCPILGLEVAQAVLEEWRVLGVFAKIVPALVIAA